MQRSCLALLVVTGYFQHLFTGVNNLCSHHGIKLGFQKTQHRTIGRFRQDHIFGREPGQCQGHGIGQTTGTAAQLEHTGVVFHLLAYQIFHDVDHAGAVR